MDIFDFDDGRYEKDIIKEALYFYQKYNDWEILEKEFKNKIDEARGWTDKEVHNCIEYIRGTLLKLSHEAKGIHLSNNFWFSTQIEELRYWNYYKKTMKSEHWSNERIKNLTLQCTEIINYLPNPQMKSTNQDLKNLCKKGLVYGNVQAGKTASIAGIISMYASVGCQLVIVLSGITSNLRWQTQTRLMKDLKILEEPHWHLLTPEKDRIGKNHPYPEALLAGNSVSIGVFKKNPYALRSLLQWLSKTTNLDVWKKNQVLIIDDECDQYSPNVVLRDEDDGSEYKHSTINGLIVDLINLFPRVSYIGYTATPFANVLNELPGEESLYPEDFIYALDKNENYYGSDKIFGSDEEPESETLDAINIVEPEEYRKLKNGIEKEIPKSIKTAINYFIIATACKYKRSLRDFSTMLIHIDLRVSVHANAESLILAYIEKLKEKLRNKDESTISVFEKIWETEKSRNTPERIKSLFPNSNETDYINPEFEELYDEILNIVSDKNLEIVVDNSTRSAEQRLTYVKENPHAIIVIGGNTLARGLTLEGLLVSYFVRSSNTYDTLLQMGRWFGYRTKYEDLSRIWTTEDLLNNFRFLCTVENEIRDEIANYSFDITPKDFAMRIKTHPRMRITRALAMQASQMNMINFAGTYSETYNLERWNIDLINQNVEATKKLLSNLSDNVEYHNNAWIYRNCNVQYVLEYINSYQFNEKNNTCKKDILETYIQKALQKGHLSKWHIVVKTLQEGEAEFQLDNRIKCYPVNRSRLNDGVDSNIAHFKDLRDARDLIIDIDTKSWKETKNATKEKQIRLRKKYYNELGIETPGMLLIYPINKDSVPKFKQGIRTELKAKQNLIGLIFLFPQIEDKDLFQYMSIPIDAISDFEEEEE